MGVMVIVLVKGLLMGVDVLINYNRVFYYIKGMLLGFVVLINYNMIFS